MPRLFSLLLLCWFALPANTLAVTADELLFTTPDSFTEISTKQYELFLDTAQHGLAHGKLLRMYFPSNMAQQYAYGNHEAVTQQILICAMEGQKDLLQQKDVDLLARSMEGLFIGFSRVPQSRTDTPEQVLENREKALSHALTQGTPLLVESLRTSRAYLYTYLIHYNMAEVGPKFFLSTAMATAVVPVRDTAVFVTVSSILNSDSAEKHLEWVKNTATAFAEMIQSANKEKKEH